MKKIIFLSFVLFILAFGNAQNNRWDWAVNIAVCPDTILHYSNANSYLGMHPKYLAPFYMETDTAGNVYVLGYAPRHNQLNKNPLIVDANGATIPLDFHFSSNINVLHYTKIKADGEVEFSKLIASEGIPFPYEESIPVKLDRNTGDLFLGFAGKTNLYQVYIGDISPQIPAGTGIGYTIVLNRYGDYINKIKIKDPTTNTVVKNFYFPDNGKIYIWANAGFTAPDFNKGGRMFVFDRVKDSIENMYKHHLSNEIVMLKRSSNNFYNAVLSEYSVDGNLVKLTTASAPLNNAKIVQALQKANGNFVLKLLMSPSNLEKFIEINSKGVVKWTVYQKLAGATKIAALDKEDNVWLFYGNNTDSFNVVPEGYITPFIARVDTNKNHTFAETIFPTNMPDIYSATCFATVGPAKIIAGNFNTQAEFGPYLLEYNCNAYATPLQQYIAKTEPGWQGTRKDLKLSNTDKNDIQIFPNPGDGRIYFRESSSRNLYLQIFNVNGLMVKQGKLQFYHDFSSLQNGTYLIRISENKQVICTSKYIKQ